MKKIALLAVGFLVAGTSAFAQETSTSTTTGGTRFGLKVGVNLPKYSFHVSDGENPETDNIVNFHVTGFADLPLGANLSFQPGLSLQGKGAQFSETALGGTTIESKQTTMWLEVPLNLVAKLPLGSSGSNIFIGAGPYAALGIAGQNKLEMENGGDDTSSDVEFGDDENADLKSMDYGINFMGGVQLGNGIMLGAGYGLGINDLRPNNDAAGNDMKQTNRVLSFSIGYSF